MAPEEAMLGMLSEPRGLLVFPDGGEAEARTVLFATLALFLRGVTPGDDVLSNLVVVDSMSGKKQIKSLLPGVETVTRNEAVNGALHPSQCIFVFASGFFRTRFSERFVQATRFYGMLPKSHVSAIRGGLRHIKTFRMGAVHE